MRAKGIADTAKTAAAESSHWSATKVTTPASAEVSTAKSATVETASTKTSSMETTTTESSTATAAVSGSPCYGTERHEGDAN
jgi:hypothetical protein